MGNFECRLPRRLRKFAQNQNGHVIAGKLPVIQTKTFKNGLFFRNDSRLFTNFAHGGKKYARSRAKTIRKFAPDLTGTSRNYAESNNRIIEIKSLLRMPLDDTDMFILDTLDDLAAEADENEDAPGRQSYPAEAEAEAEVEEVEVDEQDHAAFKLRPIK